MTCAEGTFTSVELRVLDIELPIDAAGRFRAPGGSTWFKFRRGGLDCAITGSDWRAWADQHWLSIAIDAPKRKNILHPK
jgi:hypothetical protein